MPLLAPDRPYGNPAFALSSDEVDTVLDLVCRGAKEARTYLTPGMLEVPTTIVVRKAMRRVKRALGLTNLQIRGEQEIDDMATTDAAAMPRNNQHRMVALPSARIALVVPRAPTTETATPRRIAAPSPHDA